MKHYLYELENFKSTKFSDFLSAYRTALHTGVKVVIEYNMQWDKQTIKMFEFLLSHGDDLFNMQMKYQGKYG